LSHTKQPELSIIIVSHNCKSQLQQCLLSLQENVDRIVYEIIVIDNSSEDGSQEMTASNFPDVTLISNPQNVGFSKANNQGIKAAGSDYILFLNPDTIVYPGALEILLQVIKSQKNVGGVSPALLYGDNKYQVSFGGKRDFFPEMLQKFCLNSFYRGRLKSYKNQRKAVWLSGACLLTSKDVLDEVGSFDEKFFLYYEDIDLCIRITQTGRVLLFLPEAKIFHYGGVSTQKQKTKNRFFYRQSQLYYYRKHNSIVSWHLLRLFLCLNFSWLFFWGFVTAKKDLAERKKFFSLLSRF